MKQSLTFALIALAALSQSSESQQLGVNPNPVVTGISVTTTVTFNSATNVYSYNYAVTNPASNTGYIWNLQENMTAAPRFLEDFGNDLTIPRGAAGSLSFQAVDHAIQSMSPVPIDGTVIPFGISAPSGWIGSLTVNGTGGFAANSLSSLIAPGQTLGGFSLLSHGVPMIQVMQVIPNWDLVMENDEATQAEAIQVAEIQQSLINNVYVLGPSPIPYPLSPMIRSTYLMCSINCKKISPRLST